VTAPGLAPFIMIIGIDRMVRAGLDTRRFSSFRGNESQPGKVSAVASRIARQ
jgi:hypothetical protein